MPSRFVDRDDANKILKQASDFKVRYHGSFILWITYAFIASVLLIILLIKQVLDSTILQPEYEFAPLRDIGLGVTFVTLVMAVLAFYVHFIIKRIRAIVRATEFQNVLFSSSLKIGNLFCFICNREGTVVYYDERVEGAFGISDIETINDILVQPGFSDKSKSSILDILQGDESGKVEYLNKSKKITLKIDPLLRPKGFFVLQGIGKK